MTRLTVDLPDDLANSIATMAALRGFETPQMAVELIRSSVLHSEVERDLESMRRLPDDEVTAMADLRLSPQDDERLSDLLELNGEGELTSEQESELDDLMRIQNDAMLRKAMGLAEAVRRKLRPPLSP